MKQDLRNTFKERFRSLLLPGETQDEMGKRLGGLTRNTIAQYYNGKRVPDAPHLYKICTACNVSANWLLGLSNVQMPNADIQAVADYTGLSEQAIKELHDFATTDLEVNTVIDLVSKLLGTDQGLKILLRLDWLVNLDFSEAFAMMPDEEIVQIQPVVGFHKKGDSEISTWLNSAAYYSFAKSLLNQAIEDFVNTLLEEQSHAQH